MILVDTSVWVDHLKNGNPQLETVLHDGKVFCHPMIIGELACGNLSQYDKIMALLQVLPQAITVNHDEALVFIFNNKLSGKGIGYIDAHLLASCRLSNLQLWTYDQKLEFIANTLKIGYP